MLPLLAVQVLGTACGVRDPMQQQLLLLLLLLLLLVRSLKGEPIPGGWLEPSLPGGGGIPGRSTGPLLPGMGHVGDDSIVYVRAAHGGRAPARDPDGPIRVCQEGGGFPTGSPPSTRGRST